MPGLAACIRSRWCTPVASGLALYCENATRRSPVPRIGCGRHEGFHVLRYEVPSAAWRAEDLEALLERSYALLPPCEPRWRESGTIMHEPSPASEASAGMSRCALEG